MNNFILGKEKSIKLNKEKFYICTMIKDEHPYIREWALYHKNLGFN